MSVPLARPAARFSPLTRPTTNAPQIQTAWYNFDIPFTDYQFDPSLEGVKTAAGVVRDTAAAGLEWVVDQIKSAVDAAKEWLSDRWDSLEEFASSAFEAAKTSFTKIVGFIKDPLGFLAGALMSLDAQALARAWARFSGLISTVAAGFKAAADHLLQGVNRIWGGIDGAATTLLNRVAGLTEGFLFKKLPGALQRIAFTAIDRLRGWWKSINDGWTRLFNKIKAWIDSALDTVFSFVRRVLSFGINVVIAGIVEFGKIVLFLKDLFSNPQKYVDLLAKRGVQAFDGVESRFAGVVGQYFGSAMTAAPAPAVTTRTHRQPAPEARAETRRSATWSEIGHGIAEMMAKKWGEFKSNPMAIVTGLLMDMILPVVGNINDVIHLFKEIKRIVTGPLSAGSLEELWTSLLQILDIPILIYHTVVSILMRTLMVPLIVASFIPHPLVKGIAAAVGFGLLGAFVQAEVMNLQQKLLLLKTGVTTHTQKEEAYNRIADSLIALAMAVVITVIMLILHFIANVMKGVYNFVKGKVFGIEPTPAEPARPSPAEGVPATEGGSRVLAEAPTRDGATIRALEDGTTVICRACVISDLASEFGPELAREPANSALRAAVEEAKALDPAAKVKAEVELRARLEEIRTAGKYGRTPADFESLARDPAHDSKISSKTIREREVGLELERRGDVQGPIRRDPNPAGGEFIDANGQIWDVKGFNSNFPPKKGGFDIMRDAGKVDSSLAKGENVMLDTQNMSPQDVAALKAEGAKRGWGGQVKWYP